MIVVNSYVMLEKERRKLNRLIDNALNRGAAITENEAILEQSRKCDSLIAVIQAERMNARAIDTSPQAIYNYLHNPDG